MVSMCPSAPVSPLRDIYINDNDEEMVMHLRKIINGAPLPPNVLPDVNLHNVVPWNLPENILYFFNAEDNMSLNDKYWKATGQDRRIVTTLAEGRRTTLEFYRGQAPDGEKTDWVMHKYRVDQRPQNYSLLCRVFRNVGGGSNHEEYRGDNIDTILLQFDDQEANSNSQDSTNGPQMMSGIEQGQMSDETYDYLSRGDYVELNDLVGYESSSSCSENSSMPSMTSDELFDSAALLRDLESTNNPNTEEPNVNRKFNVAAPHGPNQVVIQPPPSGSIYNATGNTSSAVSITRNSSASSPALPAFTVKLQPINGTVPMSVSGTRGPLIGPSTSQGGAIQTPRKSSRISKIGKKYCCFMAI